MFFLQWDESNWRQTAAITAYAVIALAGIIYSVLSAANASELFSAMSDMCGALVISGIMTEGVVWTMVMALGIIAEAKNRAREEGIEIGQERGIERAIQSMRDSGFSEADIQKVVDSLKTGSNGRKQS